MLNGEKGPREGQSLYTWANELCDSLPGYDLLIPDHRGLGKSTLLASKCTKKNKRNEYQACLQYLESESPLGSNNGLQGFGTTQASRDIVHFASIYHSGLKSKNPHAQLHLYGLNYGALWMNRVLQVNEALTVSQQVVIDSVIVDSPLSVNTSSLSVDAIDERYIAAWNELLNDCVASDQCMNHFYSLVNNTDIVLSNTVQSLESLFTRIFQKQDSQDRKVLAPCEGTHWKSNLVQRFDSQRLKKLFAAMLNETPAMKLILPMLYRLHRCDSSDEIWLQNLGFQFSRTKGAVSSVVQPLYFKPSLTLSAASPSEEMLYYVIAASEMTSVSPVATNGTYWQEFHSTVPPFVNRGESAITADKLRNVTAIYSDSLVDTWSTFNGPMLIMYGTLGSIAPRSFGEEWVSQYGASSKTRVARFPHAMNHMAQSTVMANKKDTRIAGQEILVDFIVNQGVNPVNETLISLWKHHTFDFDSSTKSNTYLDYVTDDGSADLWDDAPSKTIEKRKQLQLARSLGAGCGVLVFMIVIFIVCICFDGTIVKCFTNRESKQYAVLAHER